MSRYFGEIVTCEECGLDIGDLPVGSLALCPACFDLVFSYQPEEEEEEVCA